MELRSELTLALHMLTQECGEVQQNSPTMMMIIAIVNSVLLWDKTSAHISSAIDHEGLRLGPWH